MKNARCKNGFTLVEVLVAIMLVGLAIASLLGANRVFTEANGAGTYYPDELSIGDTGQVKITIANHEGALVSYRVHVYMGGTITDDIGPVILGDGEEWRGLAEFSPRQPGEDQEVEFLLYRDGNSRPYLEPLYIWVDVPFTGNVASGKGAGE